MWILWISILSNASLDVDFVDFDFQAVDLAQLVDFDI